MFDKIKETWGAFSKKPQSCLLGDLKAKIQQYEDYVADKSRPSNYSDPLGPMHEAGMKTATESIINDLKKLVAQHESE